MFARLFRVSFYIIREIINSRIEIIVCFVIISLSCFLLQESKFYEDPVDFKNQWALFERLKFETNIIFGINITK